MVEEVIGAYRQLHKIEDCFRVTKTELSARPIYVWKDEHIQAHFLTCFIALTILRIMKFKFNNEYSEAKIVEAMNSAITRRQGKGYFEVELNNELKEMNTKLGINFNNRYIEEEKLKRYAKGWCST